MHGPPKDPQTDDSLWIWPVKRKVGDSGRNSTVSLVPLGTVPWAAKGALVKTKR